MDERAPTDEYEHRSEDDVLAEQQADAVEDLDAPRPATEEAPEAPQDPS